MPIKRKAQKRAKQMIFNILVEPIESNNNCSENIVKGSLEIDSKVDFLIHGALITIHGKVWTEITSFRNDIRNNGEQKYSSSIFVQSSNILGKGTRTLALGKHSLPFTICLPPHLPSSFEGTFGAINYLCTAQIHVNHSENEKTQETKISVPLPVKRFLNLSEGFAYGSAISFPTCIERPQKTLRSTLVPSQILKFIFKVQKTGFAAGETIPFVLDLYNPDRKRLSSMSVTLMKKTVYGDLKYNIDVFDELAEVTAQPMDNLKSTLTWIGSLHVPQDVIPTHSVIASVPKKKPIFAHRYLLRVKLIPTTGTCVLGDLPVIIGTTKYECRSRRQNDHCSRTFLGGNLTVREPQERPPQVRRQSSVPPSYSQIMFPNERRSSLETLPPPYEEAIAMASRALAKETRHLMG